MAFSTDFLSMMGSTIKISTRTGSDNYGKATFAASTTSYRARIVEKPGYVRGAESEEIAYRHVIWARSTSTGKITASDRVTLPGGTVRPVVAVERYPDDDGPHHVKIMLGY